MNDDDTPMALLRLQQDVARAEADRSKYAVVWTADLKRALALIPDEVEHDPAEN